MPSRAERIRKQQVSANLIIFGRVEDDRRCGSIEVGFEDPELHPPRSGRDICDRQGPTAFAQNVAQIFLVVRHALEPWREGSK
jgi:hypothetical protein